MLAAPAAATAVASAVLAVLMGVVVVVAVAVGDAVTVADVDVLPVAAPGKEKREKSGVSKTGRKGAGEN